MTLVLPTPIAVLATDAFGTLWLPALLLEIRNGVALVQVEDYWTVRSLNEVRPATPSSRCPRKRIPAPDCLQHQQHPGETMIQASVYSDDHKRAATFNATPFFERATLEEILDLKAIGWGGDHQADAVALFFLERDASVAQVFRYLDLNPSMDGGNPLGFECHVCEKDVARWVKANKPDWLPWI